MTTKQFIEASEDFTQSWEPSVLSQRLWDVADRCGIVLERYSPRCVTSVFNDAIDAKSIFIAHPLTSRIDREWDRGYETPKAIGTEIGQQILGAKGFSVRIREYEDMLLLRIKAQY